MFATRTPNWSIRSPQSPGRSAFVNRRAVAPLQHDGAVELVVDELLEVDDEELEDVEVLEEVVGKLDEVDGLEVLDVDDVEVVVVSDVEVLDVELVEVGEVDVVVVPAAGQAPGAGAAFRLSSVGVFLMSWPPNSAH